MGVQVPRQAPFARVTELVYVSGSNPDAHGHVSSNLTSRTTYRTGVMGARLALTQEDEDRNLGAVPNNLRNNAGRLRHQFRKLWAAEMLWGSTPLFRANLQCCQSGNGSAWKAGARLKDLRRFNSFTLRHICWVIPDGSGTGLENRGRQECRGDRHLLPAPSIWSDTLTGKGPPR